MPSNWPSFASLQCDLCDDATCTTRCRSSSSFEAKIGNPSPNCFIMKQAVGYRRVSSYRLYPLIGFEAQTDKPPPHGFEAQTKKLSRWIWGPNYQTVNLGFEAQTKKPSQWFWGQTTDKPYPSVLRPKSRNPHFSSPPRVRCESHITSPDLLIVWPPSTQLVPDHPRSSAPSLLLMSWCSSLSAMLHLPPKQTRFSEWNN
jgi:hypothetical protein